MVVPNHDGLPDCRDVGDSLHPRPMLFLPMQPPWAAPMQHQPMVESVARQAGNVIPEKPRVPDAAEAVLCARLIIEEAMETVKALGVEVKLLPEHTPHNPVEFDRLTFKSVAPADLVGVVDGCCDTRVVSTFTMVICGVQGDGPQALVDRNNLDKFEPGKGGYRCPETGKWIKPPGHPKPDILGELVRQGWVPPGA